jgi:cyclophilin family peptidyl-prolyl cis-trans isomerase
MLRLLTLAVMTALIFSACERDESTYALIETSYGDITIRLFDSTPQHKDNFIRLVENEFYDGLLFHRVIEGFMIQGGDPNSRNATQDQRLGMGGPDYQIEAEIGALHLRGAVAAARNQNPEKKSSGSQFYIVQGSEVAAESLDMIEEMKGIRYTPEQRELYLERGGTPNLDMDYTVFGEVVSGMEVVDRIATVATNNADRPLENVSMKIRLLK